MGLNYSYYIIPFLPDRNKFHLRKGVEGVFEQSDADNVITKLHEQTKTFIQKNTAKKLQDALNQSIKNSSEQYYKLVDKIIKQLNNNNLNSLMQMGVVKRYRGTIKLDKTAAKTPQYESTLKSIAAQISDKYTSEDDINKVIERINGSLNKIRGDIFENLLADIFDNAEGIIDNLIEKEIDEIVESISNNIEKYSKGNFKVVNKTGKSSKVIGSNVKESLNVSINSEKISISGSQGKSDVMVKNLDGNIIGISAKNYRGTSTEISLLNSANIVNLISQWPGIEHEKKNLALNGLSAIDLYENQFDIMKKIFIIQGMMGMENEDIKSQLLIVNTNRINNPILIFSIYDLLFNQDIQGKVTGLNPIPRENLPRSTERFLNFVKSSSISISTELKLSKLQYLTK